MIAPEYATYLHDLEAMMARARALGMWRTAEQVHTALNQARSEQYEAMPTQPVTVTLKIGPVREQSL